MAAAIRQEKAEFRYSNAAAASFLPFVVIAFFGAALALNTMRLGPTVDEPAHLAAGNALLRFGRLDIYRVNPPLVKAVAGLPLMVGRDPALGSAPRPRDAWDRPEFTWGTSFANDLTYHRFRRILALARLSCLVFPLAGAWCCWKWSSELNGPWGGLVSLFLFVTCPMILGHGSLITPDIPCASTILIASYAIWRWCEHPTWTAAAIAGSAAGITLLAKMTALMLLPTIGLACLLPFYRGRLRSEAITYFAMAVFILVGSIGLVNAGYGFKGTMRPLREYKFISPSLAGQNLNIGRETGNRFANSLLGSIPVPLPCDYVQGADTQKYDFDIGQRSYANGRWTFPGTWWWYLYIGVLKIPIGAQILVCWGGVSFARRARNHVAAMVCLAFPAILIGSAVVSQTGFTSHFRYLAPCLPFGYVMAGFVALPHGGESGRHTDPHPALPKGGWRDCLRPAFVLVFLIASVASSALNYPDSIGYFNELAGAKWQRHHVAIDSNLDWGQDSYLLREWLLANRELPVRSVDVDEQIFPLEIAIGMCVAKSTHAGPEPLEDKNSADWDLCVVSASALRDPKGKFAALIYERPIQTIGSATYVFKVHGNNRSRHCRTSYANPRIKQPGHNNPYTIQ